VSLAAGEGNGLTFTQSVGRAFTLSAVCSMLLLLLF